VWAVEAYRNPSGAMPVWVFIDALTGQAEEDALALVKLVEERGNTLREPQSKALGDGLYELRRNQVRIFYMFGPGRQVVTLLSGVMKKRKRIPPAEVRLARLYKAAIEAAEKTRAR
jgi:hypothetical protein